jgi:hypothetical protein
MLKELEPCMLKHRTYPLSGVFFTQATNLDTLRSDNQGRANIFALTSMIARLFVPSASSRGSMPVRSWRAKMFQVIEECCCFGTVVVLETFACKLEMRPLKKRYDDDGVRCSRQSLVEHGPA